MFSDGTQHIDDSGCGCPRCEPQERCVDCGRATVLGTLCRECSDARVSEAVGKECAALCLDFMKTTNRAAAMDFWVEVLP